MKKTLRTLMMGMMALLAGNALTSCSSDDEPQVAQQEGQKGYVEFTLTRGADTRTAYETTSEGGLDAFWSKGDKVVVIYHQGQTDQIVEVFDLVRGAGTATGVFAKTDSQLAEKSGGVIIEYAPGYVSGTAVEDYILDLSTQEGTLDNLGNYDMLISDAKLDNGKIGDAKFVAPMAILHFPKNLDLGVLATTADLVLGGGVNTIGGENEKGNITIKNVGLTGGKLNSDVYVSIPAFTSGMSPTTLKVGDTTFALPEISVPGKVYTFAQENLKEIIPLTIEPVSSDIEITITNPLVLDIVYRVVNSDNTLYTIGYSGDSSFTIPVKAGQRLQLLGDNATYSEGSLSKSTIISCSDKSKVYGNIMSLIDAENYSTATTLTGSYTFAGLFYENTGLTDASGLLLPATTLAESCYNSMFLGCTSLTTAPELPVTTLEKACYYRMFNGCTSLTTAPSLPATTLAESCYAGMFNGCTSLTTAPELKATTLADACYDSMFLGCTSLTTAPALPATTLAASCYYNMFNRCTSLTTAPELKASTLERSCYGYMFAHCNSLITAPELPATITVGAEYCYAAMFNGCKSLTKAPELKTEILVEGCYYNMFNGCTSLNAVTCLAVNISATKCTTGWLESVAATGTFTKASSMTSWGTDASGIPSGWTVANY